MLSGATLAEIGIFGIRNDAGRRGEPYICSALLVTGGRLPTSRQRLEITEGGVEMWPWMRDKLVVPAPEECLPGRAEAIPVPERHFVNGHALNGPYPKGLEKAIFALGCFWG